MKISKLLRNVEGNGLAFMCPGCKTHHVIWHGIGKPPRWDWNGDIDKPSFSPSILVRGAIYICHSFVRNGQIQFLTDCTHDLAGKTVDLPEI